MLDIEEDAKKAADIWFKSEECKKFCATWGVPTPNVAFKAGYVARYREEEEGRRCRCWKCLGLSSDPYAEVEDPTPRYEGDD